MNIALHSILIVGLISITVQDFKQRSVYAFLFLLTGIIVGYFHWLKVPSLIFWMTLLINLSSVVFLLGVLKLYATFKLQMNFKDTFGLGDALFFLVLAIGFPTATFLVLFSFSTLFSLVLFLFLKRRLNASTVPLAGMQALFLSCVWMLSIVLPTVNLYTF